MSLIGCAKGGDAPAAGPKIPDTADGTIKAVATQLADSHPEILWEALPPSYRADINELTATFAQKMDPELYDRTMAVMNRAVQVLQEKQDIILESETMAMTAGDAEKKAQAMGSGLAMVQTVLDSEIMTLQGLGALDWENFLATTGASLMQQAAAIETDEGENPMDDLRGIRVETIETSAETATLRITVGDEDSEEVEMVRVEERWVPAEMAEEWPEMMAEARQRLEEMTPENMQQVKGQALMGLAMAEGLIEQVAAIDNVEQFDQQIGPMIQGMLGSMAGSMAGAMPQDDS
ncbi:MAG: hypothetical protein PVG92_05945 [Holophagae bacterium]